MTVAQIFRQRLRECRKRSGRTIESVSHESGFSCSYLERLESGSRLNPTILAVWSIAAALEVHPGYLLGIEP